MARAHDASRTRRLRRAGRLLCLGALVLLLTATQFGSPAAPASVAVRSLAHGIGGGPGTNGLTNLSVNLTDAPSFDPSNLAAPAGSVVNFQLANVGALNHTFTISAVADLILAHNLTPADLDQILATNGTLLNLSLAPGASISVNYSVPASDAGDSFEVLSAVPYQFQAGMFGFFNVTGGAPASSATAQDNTTDTLHFVPDQLVVNTSAFPVSLSIDVLNQGADAHTWTIEGQANNTLDPSTFTTYFQANPPLANVNVPAGAGGSVWANFTVTAPGAYEYICEASGHFANGMFGWLYVGVPAPAAAPTPSSALVQPALLVGAGALLAIGVLLVVAASLASRLQRVPAAPPKSQ